MFLESILVLMATLLALGLLGYYRYKAAVGMGKKMTTEFRSALEKSREKD